ncbi:MAG: hypothetical protein ABSB58_07605 [Gemmatimonadales bacterium]|jgi:hypothetical protein
MKRTLVPALLALALGCVFATEAAAQASYQQQIRAALRAAAGRARGARPQGEPLMGVLNGKATENRTVDLQAGVRYAIVGVCDENCPDIDMRIWGPSGAKLAEDVQQNNTPILEFTAPSAGRYRLAVEMVTCNANPCAWGVQVLANR